MEDENMTDSEVLLQKLNREILPYVLPSVVLGSMQLTTGTVGNALVLYNYVHFPKSSSHFFIVALSCYDLVLCTIVLPMAMYLNLHQMNMGNVFFCKVYMMLAHSTYFGSVFLLVAIAVDRYLKIYYPFYRMSHNKVKLFCLLTSVAGALYSLPAVVMVFGIGRPQTRIPGLKGYACYESTTSDHTFSKVFSRSLGAMFLTVQAVLFFLYFRIWRYLRLRRRAATGRSIDPALVRKLTMIYASRVRAKASLPRGASAESEEDPPSKSSSSDNVSTTSSDSGFLNEKGKLEALWKRSLQSSKGPEPAIDRTPGRNKQNIRDPELSEGGEKQEVEKRVVEDNLPRRAPLIRYPESAACPSSSRPEPPPAQGGGRASRDSTKPGVPVKEQLSSVTTATAGDVVVGVNDESEENRNASSSSGSDTGTSTSARQQQRRRQKSGPPVAGRSRMLRRGRSVDEDDYDPEESSSTSSINAEGAIILDPRQTLTTVAVAGTPQSSPPPPMTTSTSTPPPWKLASPAARPGQPLQGPPAQQTSLAIDREEGEKDERGLSAKRVRLLHPVDKGKPDNRPTDSDPGSLWQRIVKYDVNTTPGKARESRGASQAAQPGPANSSLLSLFIVTIVFFLCFIFPVIIIVLHGGGNWHDDEWTEDSAPRLGRQTFLLTMTFCQSTANPFVYAFVDTRFRRYATEQCFGWLPCCRLRETWRVPE